VKTDELIRKTGAVISRVTLATPTYTHTDTDLETDGRTDGWNPGQMDRLWTATGI